MDSMCNVAAIMLMVLFAAPMIIGCAYYVVETLRDKKEVDTMAYRQLVIAYTQACQDRDAAISKLESTNATCSCQCNCGDMPCYTEGDKE